MTLLDKVEFKDPTSSNRGTRRGLSALLIAELKAHPGQWALVATGSGTSPGAATIPFRKAGCEVTQRSTRADGYELYARWPA